MRLESNHEMEDRGSINWSRLDSEQIDQMDEHLQAN